MPYVIVIVSTEDMEGNEGLDVIGPFESEKEAEESKPIFYRSTKRMVVMEMSLPKELIG